MPPTPLVQTSFCTNQCIEVMFYSQAGQSYALQATIKPSGKGPAMVMYLPTLLMTQADMDGRPYDLRRWAGDMHRGPCGLSGTSRVGIIPRPSHHSLPLIFSILCSFATVVPGNNGPVYFVANVPIGTVDVKVW